jgi:hypothetical protein
MSLSTQSCRVAYTASAAQTTFPYSFRIFAATDLAVYHNASLLTTSQYSVTGVGEAAGGNVVLAVAAAAADEIIIESAIPATQDVTYSPGDAFPAASHERGLDRLARIGQQLRHALSRCLQLNVARSFGLTGLELPHPDTLTPVAGGKKYLSWNDSETNLTLREIAEASDAVGLLSSSMDSSTLAGLPAAGTAGRVRRVSDDRGGFWLDNGAWWWQLGLGALNVRDRHCRGDGATDDRGGLSNAQSAAHALLVPGPYVYRIASNITLTTPCIFAPGATLKPDSGVTITFARPDLVQAGPYQIVDTSAGGSMAFTTGGRAMAEWWGARADGTTDSAAAITKALNAAAEEMPILLQGGTYKAGSAITPPVGATVGWALVGQGMNATLIQRTTGYTGIILELDDGTVDVAGQFHLADLRLDGIDRTAGVVGIHGEVTNYFDCARVRVTNCATGIEINGTSGATFRQCFVQDNTIGYHFHNAGSRAVSVALISGGRLSANRQKDIYLDGTQTSGTLVREVTIAHVAIDNSAHNGRINLHINRAERILVDGVHFEGGDPHLKVDGGHSNNKVRNVVLRNCRFGGLASSPTQANTITWNATASEEGEGCRLYDCSFSDGALSIASADVVLVVSPTRLGATFPAGDYALLESGASTPDVRTIPASAGNTRIVDLTKAASVATRQMLEFLANVETTDGSNTALWTLTLATGTVAFISAHVVAQQDDGSDHAGYFLSTTVANIAGTATEIGESAIHTAHESAGAASWGMAATPSGAQARLICNGAAATDVRWCAYVRALLILADN